MNFAIKYLIEIERSGKFHQKLTPYENKFKFLLQHFGSHYNKKIHFEAFTSYYRNIELVQENNDFYFLWDKSFLKLIEDIIFCISIEDTAAAQNEYAKYYELYLLENAIKNNSNITKGLFASHLQRCGSGFIKKRNQITNNKDFYNALSELIIKFSFFHELSHFIMQVDNYEKTNLNSNVNNILQKIKDIGEDFHPENDISHNDYLKLLDKYSKNEKSREELACDIHAIVLLLDVLENDLSTLSAFYLSTIIQYKIMASFSNIRRLTAGDNTDNNYNYIENRMRIDFRGYSQMFMISNKNNNLNFIEELKRFYSKYGKLIIDKYDQIRLPVEKHFHSVAYWDSIKYLNTINEKNIPNDKKQLLTILGWL